MSTDALHFITTWLLGLGIPYNRKPPGTYFTGDYIEEDSPTYEENGAMKSTFILRGYTRKDKLTLEEYKETIRKSLPKKAILSDGSAIVISYGTANPVNTYDAEIESIKINLDIQEWRVS